MHELELRVKSAKLTMELLQKLREEASKTANQLVSFESRVRSLHEGLTSYSRNLGGLGTKTTMGLEYSQTFGEGVSLLQSAKQLAIGFSKPYFAIGEESYNLMDFGETTPKNH